MNKRDVMLMSVLSQVRKCFRGMYARHVDPNIKQILIQDQHFYLSQIAMRLQLVPDS